MCYGLKSTLGETAVEGCIYSRIFHGAFTLIQANSSQRVVSPQVLFDPLSVLTWTPRAVHEYHFSCVEGVYDCLFSFGGRVTHSKTYSSACLPRDECLFLVVDILGANVNIRDIQ